MVVSAQFLVLETADVTSLRFGLGTFFGLDSVHAQHDGNVCSKAYSIMQVTGSC